MNSTLRAHCASGGAVIALITLMLMFTPATAVSQTCSCPHQGDIDGDGTVSFIDINVAISVILFDDPVVTDPDCPRPRADLDCDDVVNIVDLLLLIQVAVGSGSPCDPCVCLTNPEQCEPDIQPSGSVAIESKTVLPGQANVVVGIYIDNPHDLAMMSIPLDIREVTPDAFPVGDIVLEETGRLLTTTLSLETKYYQQADLSATCSGPTSNGYSGPSGDPVAASTPSNGASIHLYSGFMQSGCLAAGTDGVPGSGIPSATLTFDVGLTEGTFEIDTCCNTPGHHLLMADCGDYAQYLPSFTKGVITVGEPPDCDHSTTDFYLLACPRGDIPFTVRLLDKDNNPMAGYSAVTLDFSDCDPGEFFPQPGLYPNWPIVNAPMPSDANGEIEFRIVAGGDCPDCSVTVAADCGFTKTVPVRSTDVDGDAWVLPDDFDDALGICRDLNADGIIDDADLERHLAHCCDHKFPEGPCDLLTQTIRLDPDGGFAPFDTIDVFWELENNDAGDMCTIDSVQLYQSEWTAVPVWEFVSTWIRNVTLLPGDIDQDSLEYTIPDYGKMCLRALLYTSCCTTPEEEVACIDIIRQCPPDAVCFEFRTIDLAEADTHTVFSTIPDSLDWTVDTLWVEDTIITTICTSDITPAGTAGSLTFNYLLGGEWNDFTYRIVQELFKGDMSGEVGPGIPDCTLNLVDLNFLIQQIFFNGPPPTPEDASDMNCDGVPNSIDLNLLIQVLFFNMQPPPLCGDGPGT